MPLRRARRFSVRSLGAARRLRSDLRTAAFTGTRFLRGRTHDAWRHEEHRYRRVVDGVQRITQVVLDVAQEVEASTRPPRDLVRSAYASAGALDNGTPEWLQILGDLSLETDAASDPWPPHPSERAERLAVLAAAEPYLKAIRDLLASE